jgi:ubiquinone/menaquinone biosynthesis C-methylase UbiE
VDISPRLIQAMRGFVAREHISIGGLWVADLSKLPFDDHFFDIAAAIGVLEYCTLGYIHSSLSELNRVSKPQTKMVLDIPNQEHPHFRVMLKLEEYLGRPNIPHPRSAFEAILRPLFSIERVDDSRVMLKYFVQTIK